MSDIVERIKEWEEKPPISTKHLLDRHNQASHAGGKMGKRISERVATGRAALVKKISEVKGVRRVRVYKNGNEIAVFRKKPKEYDEKEESNFIHEISAATNFKYGLMTRGGPHVFIFRREMD